MKYLAVILLVFLLPACRNKAQIRAQKNAMQVAQSKRTSTGYEEFLVAAPALGLSPTDPMMESAKYWADFYRKQEKIESEVQAAWEKAQTAGSIEAYQEFLGSAKMLKIGASDPRLKSAKDRIRDMEKDKKAWDAAHKTDTIAGYEDFRKKNPKSQYFAQAHEEIGRIERERVERAKRRREWVDASITAARAYPTKETQKAHASVSFQMKSVYPNSGPEKPPELTFAEMNPRENNTFVIVELEIQSTANFGLDYDDEVTLNAGGKRYEVLVEPAGRAFVSPKGVETTIPKAWTKISSAFSYGGLPSFRAEQKGKLRFLGEIPVDAVAGSSLSILGKKVPLTIP